jgi:hypothetical protein
VVPRTVPDDNLNCSIPKTCSSQRLDQAVLEKTFEFCRAGAESAGVRTQESAIKFLSHIGPALDEELRKIYRSPFVASKLVSDAVGKVLSQLWNEGFHDTLQKNLTSVVNGTQNAAQSTREIISAAWNTSSSIYSCVDDRLATEVTCRMGVLATVKLGSEAALGKGVGAASKALRAESLLDDALELLTPTASAKRSISARFTLKPKGLPPEDTPFVVLGREVDGSLAAFKSDVEAKFKHPGATYYDFPHHDYADEHFDFDIIRDVRFAFEEALRRSPENRVIMFDLTDFDIKRALGSGPPRAYTAKEADMILRDPEYYRSTRWFRNGKELTDEEAKLLFESYYPDLFK